MTTDAARDVASRRATTTAITASVTARRPRTRATHAELAGPVGTEPAPEGDGEDDGGHQVGGAVADGEGGGPVRRRAPTPTAAIITTTPAAVPTALATNGVRASSTA